MWSVFIWSKLLHSSNNILYPKVNYSVIQASVLVYMGLVLKSGKLWRPHKEVKNTAI